MVDLMNGVAASEVWLGLRKSSWVWQGTGACDTPRCLLELSSITVYSAQYPVHATNFYRHVYSLGNPDFSDSSVDSFNAFASGEPADATRECPTLHEAVVQQWQMWFRAAVIESQGKRLAQTTGLRQY